MNPVFEFCPGSLKAPAKLIDCVKYKLGACHWCTHRLPVLAVEGGSRLVLPHHVRRIPQWPTDSGTIGG